MMHDKIQWNCRLALVVFLKRVCSHQAHQKKIIPLTRARKYEAKGRVKIIREINPAKFKGKVSTE